MACRAIWLPCLLLLFILHAGAAWPAEKKILSIYVEGNRRIEADAVKAALKTQVGSDYSLPMIQEDIKALFSLGYFNSIEVHGDEKPEGIALIYRVEEKPIATIPINANRRNPKEKFPVKQIGRRIMSRSNDQIKTTTRAKRWLKSEVSLQVQDPVRGVIFVRSRPYVSPGCGRGGRMKRSVSCRSLA
jgi:outer membrane protein insertion porin family